MTEGENKSINQSRVLNKQPVRISVRSGGQRQRTTLNLLEFRACSIWWTSSGLMSRWMRWSSKTPPVLESQGCKEDAKALITSKNYDDEQTVQQVVMKWSTNTIQTWQRINILNKTYTHKYILSFYGIYLKMLFHFSRCPRKLLCTLSEIKGTELYFSSLLAWYYQE